MGPVFEDACRAWLARAEELPFRPSRLGAWWDSTSEHEVDVVALGPTNEVLVGTCKWGAVSDRDLAALRTSSARLMPELPPSHQSGALTYACFSARGDWGAGVAGEIDTGSVLGFTGEDLLSIGEG